MTRVLVLGSTGSIGVQALQVIDAAADLEACGLSCGSNADRMAEQATAHGIVHTACAGGGGTLGHGADLGDLMDASEPDVVLNALVGAAGPAADARRARARRRRSPWPTRRAWSRAGIWSAAVRERTGARLVPVDSEHSALFQLLEGGARDRVPAAILTASGGPFRGRGADELGGGHARGRAARTPPGRWAPRSRSTPRP